jgi:glycogen synthase
MRIAFVSHEFPPATGGGGIGTYLAHVTTALAATGHEVEVFAGAGEEPGGRITNNGVVIHRIPAAPGSAFRAAVRPVFQAVHAARPFTVLEGTDFDAPASLIKQAYPDLPYVVKLHTPRFLVDELHHRAPTWTQHIRMHLGAWRRGRRLDAAVPLRQQPEARAELANLRLADELAAPSAAIADAATAWLSPARAQLAVFPYPFAPDPALLALPAGGTDPRVTFIGRLEERKGIFDLAAAAARVHATHPETRFRFIGRASSGTTAPDLIRALRQQAGPAAAQLEFTGAVAPEELPRLLAQTAVVALPSHWESFGLACCEAMAAGRAVVASAAGGMGEIVEHSRSGVLVPPRDPRAWADALVGLLEDPARRISLGQSARERIQKAYAPEFILPQQLSSYERAIERCRTRA